MWRSANNIFLLAALVLLTALTVSGCSESNGNGDIEGEDTAGNADVAGTWLGAVSDGLAGEGTMTLAIEQNVAPAISAPADSTTCAMPDEPLSGTWELLFNDGVNDGEGTIMEAGVYGTAIWGRLEPTDESVSACVYQITGALQGGQLTGSYDSINCTSNSGTFNLSLESAAAPPGRPHELPSCPGHADHQD